jgi:hypothetical protein
MVITRRVTGVSARLPDYRIHLPRLRALRLGLL